MVRAISKSIDFWLLVFLIVLLATPFYIVSNSGSLVFAPLLAFDYVYSPPSFGFPLALAGIAAVGIRFIYRLVSFNVNLKQTIVILTLTLIGWMTGVLIYGFNAQFSYSVMFFIQTILPLGLLISLLTIPLSHFAIKQALLLVPLIGSASIVLILLATAYFLSQPYPATVAFAYLAEAFYASNNIQPIVVLAGFVILLWQFSLAKRHFSDFVLWFLLAIHIAYILVMWSRSGLLAIIILATLWSASELIRKNWTSKFLLERGLIAVALFGIIGAHLTVDNLNFRKVLSVSTNQETVKTKSSSKKVSVKDKKISNNGALQLAPANVPNPNIIKKQKDVEQHKTKKQIDIAQRKTKKQNANFKSTQRRLELFLTAGSRILSSPITGDAFNTLSSNTMVAGRLLKRINIYPSHNQYLDIAIRSGLPALALYLALLFVIANNLWKGFLAGSEFALTAIFFLVAVMTAALFHAYFVVTQSAAIIFFILAMALKLSKPDEALNAET